MKVLHIIPYMSSFYGGPPAVVTQMVNCLRESRFEVDVVTTTANGMTELDVSTIQPVLSDRVRYFYFRRCGPKSLMFSWQLRRWLYLHVRHYDLIHIHGLFSYTTLIGCAAAKYYDKPYIVSTHGMIDPWCLTHKFWKKRPYYLLIEQFNLRRAAALHVTSIFEALGVTKLGFDRKQTVIPLSVKLPPPRCKLSNLTKPGLSLLFLSRLDPIKGLPVLFRALALLRSRSAREVTLKIVGQGRDEYLWSLRAMVKELNLVDVVAFCGFLDGEAKERLLGEADIFVMPSHHENFSLATAEAMAASLPVIVTDHVGISQEINDAAAGVVVPANSSVALADAIESLGNATYRQATGANARRLVAEKFSEERFRASLLHLYEKVLN